MSTFGPGRKAKVDEHPQKELIIKDLQTRELSWTELEAKWGIDKGTLNRYYLMNVRPLADLANSQRREFERLKARDEVDWLLGTTKHEIGKAQVQNRHKDVVNLLDGARDTIRLIAELDKEIGNNSQPTQNLMMVKIIQTPKLEDPHVVTAMEGGKGPRYLEPPMEIDSEEMENEESDQL